jgi:hypothetical protein
MVAMLRVQRGLLVVPLLFVGLVAPGVAQPSRLVARQDTPEDTADVPAFPVSAVTIQDKIDWLTAEADAAAHAVDAEAEKPWAEQRESIYRGVLTRGAHLVRLLNTLGGRFPRLHGRVNEVMTSAAAGIERIANGRLKIGMTTEQVREIRGEPSSISDTSSDEGSQLHWRYGATVLVFEHGTLIEIHQMLKGE